MSAVSGSNMASQASLITSNHQQGQSPLLALPGELRNKIYSYVFDSDLEISASKRRSGFVLKLSAPCLSCECCPNPESEPTLCPTSSGAPWYGLILTCRALCSETYPLIFSMSPEISFSDLWAMENFCAYIPEAYRMTVPSIRLRLSYSLIWGPLAVDRVRNKGLVFAAMFPAVKVAKLMTEWLGDPDGFYYSGSEDEFWEEWLTDSGKNGVTAEEHPVYVSSILGQTLPL